MDDNTNAPAPAPAPTQASGKGPKMKHDGVTPEHPADAAAKPEGPKPTKSGIVQHADATTPAQRVAGKPKFDFSGLYRVKAFRIALPVADEEAKKKDPSVHHQYAHRGDLVFFTHEDAISLIKPSVDAIETEAQYDRRIAEDARIAEMKAAMMNNLDVTVAA